MRARAVVVFAAALSLLVYCGTGVAQSPAPTYEQMVAHAKTGEPGVDYQALRFAYAAKPDFNPYGLTGASHRDAMFKAYQAGDCATAVKEAVQLLDVNFVNMDGHIVSDMCYSRLGKDAERTREHAIAAGLIHSIMDSGDGKTQQTAYVVISVDEEYSILRVLGLKPGRQSLVQGDGHKFDQLDATKPDGQTQSLFFNVDRVFAAYGNILKAKPPQKQQP
ncbi:MAG TPA: DUF4919 domain-containing protein [Stellaceae bacterium]|nr:DUF4919 domain-containing protein [Stellaceae bacterium]